MTPRRIAELQAPIERIVEDLLDRMAQAGRNGAPVDFMKEFAFPMPGNVICELMGVPDGDRSWFVPRAHIFADLLDLGKSSDELMRNADEATVELTEYFGDLVAQRQAEPTGDLISDLGQSSRPATGSATPSCWPDCSPSSTPGSPPPATCWATGWRCLGATGRRWPASPASPISPRGTWKRRCGWSRRPTSWSGWPPSSGSSPASPCRWAACYWS
jgi:hypothetical protein